MDLPKTMAKTHSRKVLRDASVRCLETAKVLYSHRRWGHAIYIGGYAIEASLASWLCLKGGTNDLKATRPYRDGIIKGASIHRLGALVGLFPEIGKLICDAEKTVTTNPLAIPYHTYLKTIVNTWKHNELRYSDKVGDEATCEKFMTAIKAFHGYIYVRIK